MSCFVGEYNIATHNIMILVSIVAIVTCMYACDNQYKNALTQMGSFIEIFTTNDASFHYFHIYTVIVSNNFSCILLLGYVHFKCYFVHTTHVTSFCVSYGGQGIP